MKFDKLLHAAAITMALAAPSAQAVVIYEAPKESTCCLNYGLQPLDVNNNGTSVDVNVNLWGDYIRFAPGTPRNLTRATFWLNSSLQNPTDSLTLIIQDDDLNELAITGSWSNPNPTEYSFTFSQPLSILTDEITYSLILENVTASTFQLFASAGPNPGLGEDIVDSFGDVVSVGEGIDVNDPSQGSFYVVPIGPSGNPTYTIAARFEAVPEPATLALLSLGLVGLGFARRRKVAG